MIQPPTVLGLRLVLCVSAILWTESNKKKKVHSPTNKTHLFVFQVHVLKPKTCVFWAFSIKTEN